MNWKILNKKGYKLAVAKVEIDVKAIKAKFEKTLLSTSLKTLKGLRDEQAKLVKELAKLCEDHLTSNFNSVNVGSIVTQPGKLNIDSLQMIHTALFEAQGISSTVRVKIYPKLVDIFKSAIILYNRADDEIMNSDELAEAKSNAERERIRDFILMDAREVLDEMRSKDSQAESYLKYISDQMYHLNSLDTMIRTADKMEASELFTESLDSMNLSADKKTFNNDGSIEDDDFDEVDTPAPKAEAKHTKEEEPAEKPKPEKKVSKKSEPIEDLDNLDDLEEI